MSEEKIGPYAKRLQSAREQVGKSVEELAALVGINEPSYYDLESYDDEVLTCISIQQFALLCRLLHLSPPDLFAEEFKAEQAEIGLNSLVTRVRSYIETHRITLPEFEDCVGWDLAPFLESPTELVAERYNIDALRDVCKELGLNWVNALTGIISQVEEDV